jgi:hypothetical protein
VASLTWPTCFQPATGRTRCGELVGQESAGKDACLPKLDGSGEPPLPFSYGLALAGESGGVGADTEIATARYTGQLNRQRRS